jgi:hypothetical protein
MLIARLHQLLAAPHRAACPVGREAFRLLRSERRKQPLRVNIRRFAHGSMKKQRPNATRIESMGSILGRDSNVKPPARFLGALVCDRGRTAQAVRLSAEKSPTKVICRCGRLPDGRARVLVTTYAKS